MMKFLIPFRVATDTVQRDTATLLDVWQQFSALRQHLSENESGPFGPVVRSCIQVLDKEWNTHVNRSAIAAVALFSFDSDTSGLVVPLPQTVAAWVGKWGVLYLMKYKKHPGPKKDLQGKLTQSVLEFRARQPPFDTLNTTVDFVRKTCKSAKKSFNPLTVWGNIVSEEAKPLILVASALLRIVPTEASVERSFSAQDDVHSKDRNRLRQSVVEAEMMIKWNSRKLEKLNLPEDEDLELSDDE